MRPEKHPGFLCTAYKVTGKIHLIQKPMKKGKFTSHSFINLGKFNLYIHFLAYVGTYAEKIDKRLFNDLTYKHSSHLQETELAKDTS